MKAVVFSSSFILLLVSLLVSVASVPAYGDVSVKGLRVWRAPERTRVVVDLSDIGDYKMMMLSKPRRLVIDLADTRLHTSLKTVDLKDSPVTAIRSGIRNGNDLRIVLDLATAIKPRSFTLAANAQYGNRLVIDLLDLEKKRSAPIAVSTPSIEDKRDIVIAIDAGHGGEDPGAIGARRVKEKTVVLEIAKKLALLLDKEPGFKAYQIRTGDYFMSLLDRPNKARKARADLMLSIHADAFRISSAKGASVYTLSERGNSSTFAAELAQRENAADQIGGVRKTHDDVNRVLVDLALTASKEASERASKQLVAKLKHVAPMHKKTPERANFAVLRSSVPSLLIETGFISNPEEARRLNSSRYQQQIASALFQGVKAYFEDLPPEGTLLAWQAAKKAKVATHIIKNGETLSGIALRYRVSMQAIKALNGMQSNKIRIGQKLKIPG
ncbi:MAG: N-acetylmuramoyl-L-alanine amidase [Pseudomonadales bacterium]